MVYERSDLEDDEYDRRKRNATTKQNSPQFIPKLKGKKVIIRLVSGGQPVTGTIEGYNPYEVLLQTAKGQLLVFKHAIATIETIDETKGYRSSV
jgi:RNA chaperone Hfq